MLSDGRWHLFINAGTTFDLQGRARKAQKAIPGGGEMVLGQASRSPQRVTQFYFSLRQEYLRSNWMWRRGGVRFGSRGLGFGVGDCVVGM